MQRPYNVTNRFTYDAMSIQHDATSIWCSEHTIQEEHYSRSARLGECTIWPDELMILWVYSMTQWVYDVVTMLHSEHAMQRACDVVSAWHSEHTTQKT